MEMIELLNKYRKVAGELSALLSAQSVIDPKSLAKSVQALADKAEPEIDKVIEEARDGLAAAGRRRDKLVQLASLIFQRKNVDAELARLSAAREEGLAMLKSLVVETEEKPAKGKKD